MLKRIKGHQSDKDRRRSPDAVKPVVQTIQAGIASYGTAKMMLAAASGAGGVASVASLAPTLGNNVRELATAANDVAKLAKNVFVPSMQVVGSSFAASTTIISYFSTLAVSAGIGANVVLVYQGMQVLRLLDQHLKNMATSLAAQTALLAQNDFPQYVHDMVRERVLQTSQDSSCHHWFFVYHPDNDWYPKFYHLLEASPIGPAFGGYTNQLDTAIVYMLAARQRLEERARSAWRSSKRDGKDGKDGSGPRPTRLHLLIPAYQPILIAEALSIPEALGDFVIEGRINSNRAMNVPEDQQHYLQDIGQFNPPSQNIFDQILTTFGLTEKPPHLGERRVLGTQQPMSQGQAAIDMPPRSNTMPALPMRA